jgi:hypothetical protein
MSHASISVPDEVPEAAYAVRILLAKAGQKTGPKAI